MCWSASLLKPLGSIFARLHAAAMSGDLSAALSAELLCRCDPTRELAPDLLAHLGNTVVAFGTYT